MKFNSLLYLVASTLALFLLSSPTAGQSFQRSIYNGPPAPDVVAADVNQDGRIDLLTPQTNEEGSGFIFLNLGNGIFPKGGSQGIFAPATRVVVADFNGDGIPDIDVQSCTSGGLTMVLLAGTGGGLFREMGAEDRNFPPFASSCTNAMSAITIAGDTLPSVVFASLDTSLTIFRNDGTGHFPFQQDIFGPPGTILAGSSVGDFNGDHLQDIAAVSINPSGGPQQVVIFLQNPDGSFQPPKTIFSMDATLGFTQAVDFNGNESDDLLVPFFGGHDKRAGVIAFTNIGPGKFRSKILLADPFYTSAGEKATAIHSPGKHNGIRGILAPFSPEPHTGDSVFAFFPAEGDSWGKPVYFDVPNGTGAQAVVTADFNNDGRVDFAGVDDNNELLVFLNTTTDQTCGFPNHAGVRICSPDSDRDSDDRAKAVQIHASANGGALPIVGMKAFIDDEPVAESSMNTLDASVPVKAGRHILTVSASDRNGKVYQERVEFHAR